MIYFEKGKYIFDSTGRFQGKNDKIFDYHGFSSSEYMFRFNRLNTPPDHERLKKNSNLRRGRYDIVPPLAAQDSHEDRSVVFTTILSS